MAAKIQLLKIGRSEPPEADSRQLAVDARSRDALFSDAGAIKPPTDAEECARLFEDSNSLRQNIDGYATNIDGLGHRLEPIVDLDGDADEVERAIGSIILAERLAELEQAGRLDEEPAEPTAAEIAARREEIRRGTALERLRLERRLSNLCLSESFVALRRKTRVDLETTGNAYWEVMRNGLGQIARCDHVPVATVRCERQGDLVEAKAVESVSPVTTRTVTIKQRFRGYLQLIDGRKVFFRELGDPRPRGSKTGRYYPVGVEPPADDPPATEILHFAIYTPRGGAYGVPRWIGNAMSVRGSIKQERVSYSYWDNKAIPSMAVLVDGGGVLAEETVTQLKELFEKEIKGEANFHKCLVLQALPSEGAVGDTGKVKIRLQPLTGEQLKDETFASYDARNRDKVGESFRMPRLLRGDVRDFNRGTADASLEFAEAQVFAPERADFDWMMNRRILPSMGARYHRFVSNGPTLLSPDERGALVKQFEGALTVNEGRQLAEGAFGRQFRKITEPWGELPLVASGSTSAPTPEADGQPPADKGGAKDDAAADETKKAASPLLEDMLATATRLLMAKRALAQAEATAAAETFAEQKEAVETAGDGPEAA